MIAFQKALAMKLYLLLRLKMALTTGLIVTNGSSLFKDVKRLDTINYTNETYFLRKQTSHGQMKNPMICASLPDENQELQCHCIFTIQVHQIQYSLVFKS
mmetsp:Transcript_18395/g.38614  ORF Transcript_18395/g.38614 Transcript_18395/m.38614 type:complete len:100 (-) Transcript_18395:739-1038(-)